MRPLGELTAQFFSPHFSYLDFDGSTKFIWNPFWLYRKIEDAGGDGTETDAPIQQNLESNLIAANAITGKLNEVSKIAESLDVALRETQTILELDSTRRDSIDRKMDGTNTSIDSRGSIDVSSSQFSIIMCINLKYLISSHICFYVHF